MNEEVEIPKIPWLNNHMLAQLFDRCQFYDLGYALTYMAAQTQTWNFPKPVRG